MSAFCDPRKTWWIWRGVQMRLVKWTLALLQGRRYTVKLEPQGTGYHAPLQRLIQANPQLYPDEPVPAQFCLTQGLLAHEVGHAWFTSDWPDQEEDLLAQLVNYLEDERIEHLLGALYPGVIPALQRLGDRVYADLSPVAASPAVQALACCLAWRWAHSRRGETEMSTRLGLSPDARTLWLRVRPLVEESWRATGTAKVITLGREILEILGLPPGMPALPGFLLIGTGGTDIPRTGAQPFPLPAGALETSPGLGTGLEEDAIPRLARHTNLEPSPYLELEALVAPRAARLAEALKEPQPERRPLPHESRGRYSFRQEVRTPETPFLAPAGVDRAPRSLALYILVDRSGSMDRYEGPVREALMTLYLAALRLGIPTGIALFGEDCDLPADQITPEMVTAELAPLSTREQENVKALIAGFTGWAGYEFLDWGLHRAEAALRPRPERLRIIVCVHDGEPVYRHKGVADWDLSLERLHSQDRAGITSIGVFLGEDHDSAARMRQLFPRLVVCKAADLPEKLGNLLSSLT